MVKQTLTLVTAGNERSGKSSLLGHLLVKLNQVSPQQIYRNRRDSQAQDKKGKEYAWVLDSSETERFYNHTLEPSPTDLPLNNQLVTIYDAPGRSDLVPGFIQAANQADCMVLVVDSREKAFRRDWEGTDQTKEHCFIGRGLGMTQAVVAVNKMEKGGWSEGRFVEIGETVGTYMRTIGFKEVVFVPVSALLGTNLTELDSSLCPWYHGPTLVQALSSLQPLPRESHKPIRFTISDSLTQRHGTHLGNIITGKVESGVISIKTKLFIVPSLVTCTVKQIVTGGEMVDRVVAGWIADISLGNMDGEVHKLAGGDVASGDSQTVSLARVFRVNGITFDLVQPIVKDQSVIIYIHNVKVAGHIRKLITLREGQTAKLRPRLIPKYKVATLEVEAEREIPMEKQGNIKALGRVVLRTEGRTVLCGAIAELLE